MFDQDENRISDSTTKIWPKKDYRTCQYCSQEMHKFSLKRHEESCQKLKNIPKNNENLAKNEENVDKNNTSSVNNSAAYAARIEFTPSKRICQTCNADYTKKGSRLKDYLQHIGKKKNAFKK